MLSIDILVVFSQGSLPPSTFPFTHVYLFISSEAVNRICMRVLAAACPLDWISFFVDLACLCCRGQSMCSEQQRIYLVKNVSVYFAYFCSHCFQNLSAIYICSCTCNCRHVCVYTAVRSGCMHLCFAISLFCMWSCDLCENHHVL